MSARRQIIAALSEDRGGIATLYDVAGAQQLADAHQTEVRREDAALIENAACDADWDRPADYCQGLRAGAELLLAKTTEKATAEATTATPDFFQPGHTYTKLRGTWLFQCAHVATHPGGTGRVAFGWLRRNEKHDVWLPNSKSESAWTHDGWTDVAEVSAG